MSGKVEDETQYIHAVGYNSSPTTPTTPTQFKNKTKVVLFSLQSQAQIMESLPFLQNLFLFPAKLVKHFILSIVSESFTYLLFTLYFIIYVYMSALPTCTYVH